MIWGCILCLGIVTAVGCRLTSFDLAVTAEGLCLGVAAAIVWALVLIYCRARLPRLVPPVHALVQVILLGIVMAVLQYPATRIGGPVIDAAMTGFDRRIGVSWPALFWFVYHHWLLADVLGWSYAALLPQLVPVILVVGVLDPGRLRSFVVANLIGQVVTVIAAAMWPVGGAFLTFRPFALPPASWPMQFAAVRAGTVHVLHLTALSGIVQFPSYHAMLAVFVMYAVARLPPWMMMPVWAFETIIIASAPVMGGHHIADVVAGVIAAILAIVAARALPARDQSHKHSGAHQSGHALPDQTNRAGWVVASRK